MYCGDDVEAVVGDIGTNLSKFGLAGEDTPRHVVPTIVGQKSASMKTEDNASNSEYVVNDYLMAARHTEILRPMNTYGSITNWDALEQIWKYAFEHMYVDSKEHPVITTAPSNFSTESAIKQAACDAEKYMELMFEKFDIPCFYMAKDAVLDAFAFGRSSALIVEIGAGATRVVPVFDGYPLQKPAQYSSIGCNRLSEYLAHLVSQSPKTSSLRIRPRCCFSRKVNSNGKVETTMLPDEQISPPAMPVSYLDYMTSELFRDMRESVCLAAGTVEDVQSPGEEVRYELPDGQSVFLGRERHEVVEHLLHPPGAETAPIKTDTSNNGDVDMEGPKLVVKGLSKMIYDAAHLCDADIRRDMFSNIILCGGGSLTPGLTERLHSEVSAMVPSSFKVRFTSVMKVERQFSCFIGGSILASLGSFQQLWVSRREYDEKGPAHLNSTRFL